MKAPIAFVVASLFVATAAFAQTGTSTPPSQLTFPIAELGNCASKEECRMYCDVPANKEACVAYAEAHGLFNKAKAAAARMIIKKQGPGGCTTQQECREFCAQEANRDACYAFAVRHGLKNQEDANRAKSFQNALKTSGGPGGCATTQSCKEYCSQPEHTEECKRFAELHGFMRLRNSMSSTTPMRPDKISTTTRPIPPGLRPVPPKPATTTQNMPSTYVPRTGLGAAVINFVQVLHW